MTQAENSQIKLAFYMTGAFAKILRRCPEFLDWKTTAICPNWQAYVETQKEPKISEVDYLYDGFNEIFDSVDVDRFCEKYPSINLSEVLMVDKSHFKAMPGDYQLRYICAMGEQIARVYEKTRPDFVLFPIIESIDAMLAYRMAEAFGIEAIVHSHIRITHRAYFTNSHRELLPRYVRAIERSDADVAWAKDFLDRYRANPTPFKTYPTYVRDDIYEDFREKSNSLSRLIRNIRLKLGKEKHNQMLNFYISFLVRFKFIYVPVRHAIYALTERFYIRPKAAPSSNYDFYPLHCSPEASINTPAPFYVDQIRVVDQILLERSGNRTLVVKEHPAMFGHRPLSFFSALKERGFVSVVIRSTPSKNLIKNATTVYSVTGTACVEAFFLGVAWVQFGNNYLIDWVERRKKLSEPATPEEFICDVLSVSGDFVLYSPGYSYALDQQLFSRSNVQRLCEQLRFHVKHTRDLVAAA